MHGEIGLSSAVDCGSTFWFELPLPAAAPATTPAALPDLAGRRVLVVDDNATNRKVFYHLLLRWRAQVECVDSATTAMIELCRAANAGSAHELILLDHHLPEMDGLSLARAVRAEATLPQPTMIMLSSGDERLSEDEQHRHGLSAFDCKPIGAARLWTLIQRALGSRPAVAPPAPATTAAPPEAPGVHVLVAEDNRVNQKVAAQYLKNAGLVADIVPNGHEACEALRRHRYRLVLMDVQMPVMDGLEATRQIRQRQNAGEPGFDREIHIVAMTANAMAGDRELCLAAGMDDYITKPLTPTALQTVLSKYFSAAGVTSGESEVDGAIAPQVS